MDRLTDVDVPFSFLRTFSVPFFGKFRHLQRVCNDVLALLGMLNWIPSCAVSLLQTFLPFAAIQLQALFDA